jgi:RNA polymerase sigma factor (TIGR02999 family)
VHEAYVRLVDETRVEWRDRTHFFRTAAQTMRRILVDHARGRRRAKRGGDYHRVTLDVNAAPTPDRKLDVLELDELLTQLAALNERHAQVVQLRFFGGLTIQEVADVLGVSTTTIEDDWAMARAWLRRHLSANRA